MTRWQCRRYRPWLVDHADGVLDTAGQARLAHHLAACPSCRADLDVLRNLPEVLQTSTVPDPGDAFWLQQRQAIGRAIRNLPEPRTGWSLAWLRDTLQRSPWRHPIAAAAALLLAVSVYRIAEQPRNAANDSVEAQLAALDTEVLAALDDLAAAVSPADEPLNYTPREDEVAFAALAVGDFVGAHPMSHVPDATDLGDAELERVDDLIGNVG